MKRILLISYNFYPELTGIGKYNGEMVEWLVLNGYDCTVLTAYPYYPNWKIQNSHRRKRFWYSTETPEIPGAHGRLTVHRCPLYVPQKPSGLGRMLLEVSFLISAFVRLLALTTGRKYDALIAVAPSFQVGLLGLFYKSLRGAKLIYHIQDLQIEAARDLNIIRSKRLIDFMFTLERYILQHADINSTISDGMLKKVQRKSGKSIVLFPNWTNTSQLFPIADRGSVKTEFGFKETDKIVLYSGAIGEKQGLESILRAAQVHRENRALKFVICGNGPYRQNLEDTARRFGLSNVVFLPLQPLGRFNHFLNVADIHLIVQKGGASDLVMPSKLGGILAVGGLALITAARGTSLHSLIHKHNMGYVIDTDDQEALNHAVGKMLTGDFEFMRENARSYAVNFISHEIVMRTFEQKLIDVLSRGFSVELQNETLSERFSVDKSVARSLRAAIDDKVSSSGK